MLELLIDFAAHIKHRVLACGVQQHDLEIRTDEAEELSAYIGEGK